MGCVPVFFYIYLDWRNIIDFFFIFSSCNNKSSIFAERNLMKISHKAFIDKVPRFILIINSSLGLRR